MGWESLLSGHWWYQKWIIFTAPLSSSIHGLSLYIHLARGRWNNFQGPQLLKWFVEDRERIGEITAVAHPNVKHCETRSGFFYYVCLLRVKKRLRKVNWSHRLSRLSYTRFLLPLISRVICRPWIVFHSARTSCSSCSIEYATVFHAIIPQMVV